ncbi:hypothetical protein HOP50_01g09410 [Chloropicon primus]|uniref:AP-5 complex subunit zeta-1 C-terminal TPR domain-containing protein n=2 Tax=Chloropicon primus TaxID=1764295 RepID=A0A5B8MD18_9CHLO|nr:hypothetical protein A3770_01p09540 [Chloropicon primus]UPQ97646.1 hypothetical protein HOP50_01g09410 [Chloropicon primus]|eukprot:QDZ18436.1 hypothetical protein A3770_01p09540 [Chloropicon primus]
MASRSVDEAGAGPSSSPPVLGEVEGIALQAEADFSRLGSDVAATSRLVQGIRRLGSLSMTVTAFGGDDDVHQRVEAISLGILRNLSKKITQLAGDRGPAPGATSPGHCFVLIVILEFVLERQCRGSDYLFDTRRCLSALFGRLFQRHYRDAGVSAKVFELCTGEYREHLLKTYCDLICEGWPTALKAAVLQPEAFAPIEGLSCFLESMVSSNMCIPLVQSILDAPCLALLMDDDACGYRAMVEDRANMELLRSIVEKEHGRSAESMMRVEDIFNMLSPNISDIPHTLDVPHSRAKLVQDIMELSLTQGRERAAAFRGDKGAKVVDNLMPELLNAVFDYILESPQGLVGNLCSIITLVLNRVSSGSFYPSTAFGEILVEAGLTFISNALRLKPKMLVMLKKALLNVLILEGPHSAAMHCNLQKVKTRLLREIGVILSENPPTPFFEDFAYQMVDTLETVVHERARVWQDKATRDSETLKLVCAAMTAMARIVLVHKPLLTRVQLMLKKVCHSNCHPFVLNRANESLKLVQMPELSYLLLLEDCGQLGTYKEVTKLF